MNLWRHQSAAVELGKVELAARNGASFLVQFPPGAGKTEVAARLAVHWVESHSFSRALVAVPSLHVLAQFCRRLAQLTALPIDVEHAGRRANLSARIIVATHASLWKRLDKYPFDSLVLFDEAHHANLDAPENVRIVKRFTARCGLTATPWTSGCRELFGRCAKAHLTLSDAQALGLAPPYSIVEWSAPQGPWGLVFCSTNKQAAKLSAAHYGSSWIGVELPDHTRQHRLQQWRAGVVSVLYCNRMLLEGADEPRCSDVWIEKHSASDVQLVQMAGRALRMTPGKHAVLHVQSRELRTALEQALARCNER